MKHVSFLSLLLLSAGVGHWQSAMAQDGPYKVLSVTKVGGEGNFDYVTADSKNRRLYVARSGPAGHVSVFNLDTLAATGEIPNVSGHGATVDVKYGHGFTASKPITMFDAKNLSVIKTIEVQGNPDGYLADPSDDRVYVLSHVAPNLTIIDAKDGAILGTVDLGGAPEQAVTDKAGHLYIDLEDKSSVAVVDTKKMALLKTFDISSHGGGCAGLALDIKNSVLFAACREKSNMIILSATDGHIITDLPIGKGSDGAVFNPDTNEAFSSQGDGTLSIIKEDSPSSFRIEETLKTPVRAKTLTLDSKTGKLFLITAEYGEASAPAPAQRSRPPMVPGSFSIITVGK